MNVLSVDSLLKLLDVEKHVTAQDTFLLDIQESSSELLGSIFRLYCVITYDNVQMGDER